MQDKLLAVRGEVTAALDALKEGLERRQGVASAKALLELMQDTAHVMSKVCTRPLPTRHVKKWSQWSPFNVWAFCMLDM